MKHLPQFAFYAAAAVLFAGSLIHRASTPASPSHGRVALSLAVQSGHVDVSAELAGGIFSLRF